MKDLSLGATLAFEGDRSDKVRRVLGTFAVGGSDILMSFRLRTSDGNETLIPKIYLNQMSLFQRRPDLADSGSYQLGCKAGQKVLHAFVDKVYDGFARVEVTEDNFEELRNLCEELGFSKLDEALREFSGRHAATGVRVLEERVDDVCRQNQAVLRLVSARHEGLRGDVERLKSQIVEHERVLEQVRRQLGNLLNEKLVERIQALEANSKQMAGDF